MKRILSLVCCLCLVLCGVCGAAETTDNFPFTDPNVTAPGTLPICKERGTVSICVAQDTQVEDYDTNWSVQYVEDMANVDIVWELMPSTEAEAKFDLLVASNSKLADVTAVKLTDMTALKYGQAGVLIPLNYYYENGGAAFLEARMEEVGQPNFLSYLTSSDGNIYVLGKNNTSFGNIVSYRAWLNDEWMQKLGLEQPKDVDELLNVLRHFRDDDPNGNGLADEIPMVGATDGWCCGVFPIILNMFDYYDALGNYHTIENGELSVVYDRETYRDALRLAKQMIDEKLLSELSFTQDSGSLFAMAAQEPTICGIITSGSKSSYGANGDSYVTLQNIAGPDGHLATTKVPQVPGITCAITSSCENPDLAFRLMESLYGNEEWETIQYLGIPGTDWLPLTDDERIQYDIGIPGNKFVLRLNLVHGVVTNSNLHQAVFPTLTTSAGIPQLISADENGNIDMEALEKNRATNQAYDALKVNFPEEVVEKIIYTQEESDNWNEMRTVILSYVNECQARFIVGDLDIEKDWDAYISELEAMGYKDMLEMDRAAYARTVGK